jgi:predicted component of type VI protein secretion system
MNLVIRCLSFHDGELTEPLVARFDQRGGTIGRSFGATLALPDPERLISRVQAEVTQQDGNYWLEDVGRSRSVVHNGRLLGANARVRLAVGDELYVGGYRLAVEVDDTDSAPAADADLAAGAIALDAGVAVAAGAAPQAAGPIAGGSEPSIDDLLGFGDRGASGGVQDAAPPKMGRAQAGGDAAPPPNRHAEQAASGYSADEIWRGFLEGAGVDVPLPNGITPAMMRTVGEMLRAAVEGLLQLIAMRAAAKDELRADRTLIQAQENNPLKFSPDVNAALLQLLKPPGRGFLPGVAALEDAVDDLRSHQVGTMAGMRYALSGVLKRFEPALLDRRLTERRLLEAVLPMNRKARLWELFLENYARISSEAAEDFHVLFGDAFMEAYTEQVRLLKQRGRGRADD